MTGKPITLLFKRNKTSILIPFPKSATTRDLKNELYGAFLSMDEDQRDRLTSGGIPDGKNARDIMLGLWKGEGEVGEEETGEWVLIDDVGKGRTLEELEVKDGSMVAFAWNGVEDADEFVVEISKPQD
ncbi:hypothetical protein BJ508DRAFT_410353 [Ascobolus immersus RN42]|uniref:Uncharacterized protein n=1 Tax=Ascobolus immersus RN42 TaxID=1160509 RepID=A0A3N4INV3_ASCIM|nr:hypothetical protein BJ508DRAFT_410353 [Ascobolus immersus RN42]